MSIRQNKPDSTPSNIPHTGYILNFHDDPTQVYVDKQDLGVSNPHFPIEYNGAHENPWLCYDEALVQIRSAAAVYANHHKGNGGGRPIAASDIKLFTDDSEMLKSHEIFAAHDLKLGGKHEWLRGANGNNQMQHIDTSEVYSGDIIPTNIRRFPKLPDGIRETTGSKVFGGDGVQGITQYYRHFFEKKRSYEDRKGQEKAVQHKHNHNAPRSGSRQYERVQLHGHAQLDSGRINQWLKEAGVAPSERGKYERDQHPWIQHNLFDMGPDIHPSASDEFHEMTRGDQQESAKAPSEQHGNASPWGSMSSWPTGPLSQSVSSRHNPPLIPKVLRPKPVSQGGSLDGSSWANRQWHIMDERGEPT